MVRRLIFHLILILTVFKYQPGTGEGTVQHNVDFIEGEPVFHQPVKCFKAGARVASEELDHFAVAPRAVLHHQMHWHIEVAQRDQRFDAVLLHSSKTER